MKKIEIIIEATSTGYSAYAKEFEKFPVGTTGRSLPQLKSNMVEALNLFFEDKKIIQVEEADLKITLDLKQFFRFYKVINAKALSERMGMNQSLLAQYIQGNKKPSASQTQRILKGVQQVGKEPAAIRFFL